MSRPTEVGAPPPGADATNEATQMQGWIVDEPNVGAGPQLRTMPRPRPGPDELLVAVESGGVNFSDLLMISGRYQVRPDPPFIPGQEITGTVVTADADGRFPVGTRVASKVLYGGFAQYATVRADMAIELPDDIDAVEGAALPVVYPTAQIALRPRAQAQAGETLLVHAAAGAIGLAVVQLAHAYGLRVIATASTTEKLTACQEHGADWVVNYRGDEWPSRVREITDGRGVDIVFDPVGGEVTDQSLKLLGRGGRLLVVGFSSGRIPAPRLNLLLLKSASIIGIYWNHDNPLDRPLIATAIDEVLHLRREGRLRLAVGAVYPFESFPQALSDLTERRTIGKSVLTAWPVTTPRSN